MSSIQIGSLSKFRYERLKHEGGYNEIERDRVLIQRPKSWFRFRFRFRKIPIRRRFRLKIPSLKRLWRKRVRLVSSMRISYAKVLKRFKDNKVHFCDLFAGNYLFMQVNPSSLKYLEKEFSVSKIA